MVKEVYVLPEIFEPLGVPRSQLELRFPSVTFNERFKKYFAMDMVDSKYIPMVRTPLKDIPGDDCTSQDIGGASGASGGRGRGGRGRGRTGGRGRGRGESQMAGPMSACNKVGASALLA
eukprot:2879073-Karenia_brevis.AAC.1